MAVNPKTLDFSVFSQFSVGTTTSPTSRNFLRNQAAGIAAIDMFVVASTSFRLLYVMIILAHDRRTIVRFDVTRYPTAGWLGRQVTDTFPWDTAPRYLLDRDASYGAEFCKRVDEMGIQKSSRHHVHLRRMHIDQGILS